jgi:hypothetical protein
MRVDIREYLPLPDEEPAPPVTPAIRSNHDRPAVERQLFFPTDDN